MATVKKCKYCLSPLDDQGYCSRPCKMGALAKKKAELEAIITKQKNENKK